MVYPTFGGTASSVGGCVVKRVVLTVEITLDDETDGGGRELSETLEVVGDLVHELETFLLSQRHLDDAVVTGIARKP